MTSTSHSIPPGQPPANQESERQIILSRRRYRQLTAPPHGAARPAFGVPQSSSPAYAPSPSVPRAARRRFHFLPAFWTITSFFSLGVNVVLVVILILLGNQLFSLKAVVEKQLIGGLAENFQLMDQARITSSVEVNAQVPAKFDLPLQTNTAVTLTQDTLIDGAYVSLVTGGLSITRARTNITLPAGTVLPVQLNLMVPVDQQIPVQITVPVDIPLNQTELHEPFMGLNQVVQPYQKLLDAIPNDWQAVLCGKNPSDFCKSLIP